MWRLVLIQFKQDWLINVFIIVCFFAICFLADLNNPIGFFLALLIMRSNNDFLKRNQLLNKLILMPLPVRSIVQAKFIYEAIIFSCYFLALVLSIYSSDKPFAIAIIFGFYSIFIILNGHYSKKYFSHADHDDRFDFLYSILSGIGLIVIHFLLVLIEHPSTLIIRCLIVPVLASYLYYRYYKKSLIAVYEREFVK